MNLGKLLVVTGFVISGIGLLLWLGPKLPGIGKGLQHLGRLPGDIRIEKENFSFYFPWVTCLVLSAVFTLLLRLFRGKS